MSKLNILWTTTNKDTITNMITMYASHAIEVDWWKEINIIIWGGSAKLVGEDSNVQSEVSSMIKKGISIQACKACADQYGVAKTLENLGIKVEYMGEPLTSILKQDEKLLTL